MRKKRLGLYVLLMSLAMLLCACSGTGAAVSPSPQSTDPAIQTISLEGAGLTLSFSVDDLKARNQVEIQTTNIDSKGEVAEVTGKGISLTALLTENGVKQEDLFSVTFTASDGYIMTVPQDILAARELYILFEINGEALSMPRSAIPEERAMYWVRDLAKVELSAESTTAQSADKIILFQTGAAALESETLNNRGEDAVSTSLSLFCQTYLKALPAGFVAMNATENFSRQEKAETFLSCYVTYDGEDAPLYFSETLADGMRVKNLVSVMAGDELIYFGRATIDMEDLAAACSLSEGASYDVTAVDGFSLTVTSEELKNGSLQFEDGSFTAVFPDVTKSGGKVKNILSIAIVD